MYTRSFLGNEEKLSVPENYDGNAFFEPPTPPVAQSIPEVAATETKISPRDELLHPSEYKEDAEDCSAAEDTPVFEKFSISKFLPASIGNFFKFDSFRLGSEEILIIAIAAFLFFSKGGDKECAIFLLLLLFVN